MVVSTAASLAEKSAVPMAAEKVLRKVAGLADSKVAYLE